jgi:zinc protease
MQRAVFFSGLSSRSCTPNFAALRRSGAGAARCILAARVVAARTVLQRYFRNFRHPAPERTPVEVIPMIRTAIVWAAVSCVVATAAGAAEPARVHVDFTQSKLSNGLRVQLAPDNSVPVVAITIAYDVGSRNETAGLTGFAHLFEHMMFKGSANVGDGEHFYQVLTNGGSMNGTTSNDQTLYYETLPANQLALALFLEADRMRSLAITQDNLDNQRQAVQEERRSSVDNQPYGKSDERFDELFYDNFAYKHSVIGSMTDLNAASVADVSKFFKIYYSPNNAVLTLAGDFKPDDALKLIRKYFGDIPRQPDPPAVDLTEPKQNGERRDALTDSLARLTQVQIGFKTLPGNKPDQQALQVLSSILQGGDSSRLYQKLNKEQEMVVSIGGYVDERIGTGGFYIGATVRPGRKSDDVEASIYEEIARLQTESVAPWELQKAKNATRFGLTQNIRSTQSRATILAVNAVKFDDPNLINTRLDRINAVTREDVQRVAKQYLVATNRTVVVTTPAPPQAGSKP